MATVDSIDRYLGIDAEKFTPPMAQAVLAFGATDDVKKRVSVLADKASLGTITEQERSEYERYIQIDELITVLKSRARRFLSSPQE
jgi:hypothetical protein